MGTETKAILEFLGSGMSEPKNSLKKSNRSKKNLKQSRLVTLCGVEWLAHQLLRELASESVDIGSGMPEWDKTVEVEENESWEALKEFDKQVKLEAEKRRKNKNENGQKST